MADRFPAPRRTGKRSFFCLLFPNGSCPAQVSTGIIEQPKKAAVHIGWCKQDEEAGKDEADNSQYAFLGGGHIKSEK